MGQFEDYSDAFARFGAADEKLNKYASLLRTVSDALTQTRGRFSFSNTSVGFPMEVIMSQASRSADGNDFPTAQKINEALADWHDAKKNLSSIWHSLPQAQRDALKPPPAAALQL